MPRSAESRISYCRSWAFEFWVRGYNFIGKWSILNGPKFKEIYRVYFTKFILIFLPTQLTRRGVHNLRPGPPELVSTFGQVAGPKALPALED